METVGIRELKNQASRIVRTVRDQGAEYVITVRGVPVAVMRGYALDDAERLAESRRAVALERLDDRARDNAAAWTARQAAVELIEEQRRG